MCVCRSSFLSLSAAGGAYDLKVAMADVFVQRAHSDGFTRQRRRMGARVAVRCKAWAGTRLERWCAGDCQPTVAVTVDTEPRWW